MSSRGPSAWLARPKGPGAGLFSDALKEYLARHTPDSVTEAMNRACAELALRRTSSLPLRPVAFLERANGISQGEIWWADLAAPTGPVQVSTRPVVVVQCDALNRSRLATTVCVPLTSNVKMGRGSRKCAPLARLTGLPKDSLLRTSLKSWAVGQGSLDGAAGSSRVKSWSYFSLDRRCTWKVVTRAVTRADPIRCHLPLNGRKT